MAATEVTPPLGPIAVSLSGGGARAAAFHLGTLSCLDSLDMLEDVSILSSVSGGTFTAAKYALTLKQAPEGEDLHDTFRRFFDSFYEFLFTADLVSRALKRLSGKDPETPSPRRTLVKALADVYDETFMEGARFDTFFKGRKIHLKDIIFNSTECKDGLTFRFWKSERPVTIGSRKLGIKQEHAEALRMGDIVAASSDIPVALEPLLYPQDFVWPKDKPDLWREARTHLMGFGVETLPLMDGGVIDNQGIEGVMLAAFNDPGKDDPRETADGALFGILREEELGLCIISDVNPMEGDIYKPSISAVMGRGSTKPGGRLTLDRLRAWAWAVFILSGITVAEIIAHTISLGSPFGPNWDNLFFLHLIPLALAGTLCVWLFRFRLQVRELLRLASPIAPHLWERIKHLTVFDIAYMAGVRLSSTWALTRTIFLNRIRRLMYYAIYSAKMAGDAGGEQLRGEDLTKRRLVPCEIYCLTQGHEVKPDWRRPTTQMQEIAGRAAKVPVTLWLNRQQRHDLVVCGHITTWFNMLNHLYDLPEKEKSARDKQLLETAKGHWEELKGDPDAFLPRDRSPDRASSPDDPLVRKAKA